MEPNQTMAQRVLMLLLLDIAELYGVGPFPAKAYDFAQARFQALLDAGYIIPAGDGMYELSALGAGRSAELILAKIPGPQIRGDARFIIALDRPAIESYLGFGAAIIERAHGKCIIQIGSDDAEWMRGRLASGGYACSRSTYSTLGGVQIELEAPPHLA